MKLNEYQESTRESSVNIFSRKIENLVREAVSLNSEGNKLLSFIRENISGLDGKSGHNEIKDNLSGIILSLAKFCNYLNINLQDVAEHSLKEKENSERQINFN